MALVGLHKWRNTIWLLLQDAGRFPSLSSFELETFFFLHFRKPRDTSSSVFPLFLLELKNVSASYLQALAAGRHCQRALSAGSWQSCSGFLPPCSPGGCRGGSWWNVWQRIVFLKCCRCYLAEQRWVFCNSPHTQHAGLLSRGKTHHQWGVCVCVSNEKLCNSNSDLTRLLGLN